MPISNAPIWMVRAAATPAATVHLAPDERWDLVVVGAGATGLFTAYEAARAGMKVVVIEAGVVGCGSSGRGMGMATLIHGDRFGHVRRTEGQQVAVECATWAAGGLAALASLVNDLHLACGWTPATSYVVATTEEGASRIDREADVAMACGLPVYASTAEELPFQASAALGLDGGAHLDPLALVRGLASTLSSWGVPIAEGTRVHAVREDRRGVSLMVRDGILRADRVVFATRFPITGSTRLIDGLIATRECVVAGASSSTNGRLRGVYTAVDDGGWSCRPRSGEGDGWLLMAGGPRAVRMSPSPLAQRSELHERAERSLAMTVSRSWTSAEVQTATGVPAVGSIGRHDRCFAATGLGQWGAAGAAAAATLLGQLVCGYRPQEADLFDPSRVRASGAGGTWRDAWRRVPRPSLPAASTVSTAMPPAPGSGVVGRRGRTTVATSCDADGTVVMLRARCPHRGGLVRFDDVAQEWECPRHGSRFDRSGAVLDGPSTAALTPFRPSLDDLGG